MNTHRNAPAGTRSSQAAPARSRARTARPPRRRTARRRRRRLEDRERWRREHHRADRIERGIGHEAELLPHPGARRTKRERRAAASRPRRPRGTRPGIIARQRHMCSQACRYSPCPLALLRGLACRRASQHNRGEPGHDHQQLRKLAGAAGDGEAGALAAQHRIAAGDGEQRHAAGGASQSTRGAPTSTSCAGAMIRTDERRLLRQQRQTNAIRPAM